MNLSKALHILRQTNPKTWLVVICILPGAWCAMMLIYVLGDALLRGPLP